MQEDIKGKVERAVQMGPDKNPGRQERLGLMGTLVLHSQFILIGILVIGAAVLTLLH